MALQFHLFHDIVVLYIRLELLQSLQSILRLLQEQVTLLVVLQKRLLLRLCLSFAVLMWLLARYIRCYEVMDLHTIVVFVFDCFEEAYLPQVGLDHNLIAWLEVKLEEMLLGLLRNKCLCTSLFYHFEEVGILFVLQRLLVLIIYDLFEHVDLLGLRLLRDVLHDGVVRLRLFCEERLQRGLLLLLCLPA